MPEYKHRVTVTKSTSNNQICINIENMGDCIVDVSWNDCEDTSNTETLVDSESCSHAKTEDETCKKKFLRT